MIQEIFFVKLGRFDRKNILDKKFQELNEDGWRVVSITYDGTEYMILAEKEPPPPVIFSLPTDTTMEELDAFREGVLHQHEHGALKNHQPLLISGDVKVERLSSSGIQHTEITREMLDSWFERPHAEESRRMDDIRHRLYRGELTIEQALDELGIDSGSYL